MKDKMIDLIKYYLKDVKYFIDLLNEKSEKEKGFQLMNPTGFLDENNTISYTFYGTGGIIFKSDNKSLRFEAYYEGRCDSFSPYSLYYYIDTNKFIKKKFTNYFDSTIIMNSLEELYTESIIDRKNLSNDRCTYFLKDITPIYFISFPPSEEAFLAWSKNF